MTETIGIILQNVAALAGLWGIFWQSWDHRASAPVLLLVIALVALGIGRLLS